MANESGILYKEPSTSRTGAFWRLDTRSIIGGVFFGIVMSLVVALGDRTDTALTGGTFLIFGGISWAAIMGISTLLCRQPAGVIAGMMEGVVAVATGASPLAPLFIIVNAIGSLAYSLVAWKLPMKNWANHALAQVAGNLTGNALVGVGLYYILSLPVDAILLSCTVTSIAGIVGGTFVTKVVAGGVAKSGLLD